jgi:hypothetical protein
MTPQGDGNRRLDSWKAIAEYLGRDVGTVRRWEKAQGLPVRRVPGGPGRSVFAFTADIDAWLRDAASRTAASPQAEPAAQPPDVPRRASTRPWKWAAAAAALATVAIAAAIVAPRTRPLEERIKIELSELGVVAVDVVGAERWRHMFPREHQTILSQIGRSWAAMAGSDPAAYVLTSHRHFPDERVLGGELFAFDRRGHVLRTFSFEDEYRLRGITFAAPWAMTTLAAGEGGRVAVAAHHYLWEPSIVTVLDRTFTRRGTFVHAGWIEGLHWLGSDRLLMAGFSQSRDGGMIGILDTSAMDGQGPEEPGSEFYCEGCGSHRPLRMVVMPRSELNVVTGSRFNRAIVEVLPDRLIARTVEIPEEAPRQGAADAIYELTYGLDLITATYGARYWEKHRALEAAGRLRHSREECPERFGPRQILAWEPATGWKPKPLQAVH